MTLLDAGPLIALIDPRDEAHDRCREAFDELGQGLITTLPVVTEALHVIGVRAGPRRVATAQDRMWDLLLGVPIRVAAGSEPALRRAAALMRTYGDHPMDFGDATLVALAEELAISRVFTLDKHFRVYRLHGRRAFQVVPG